MRTTLKVAYPPEPDRRTEWIVTRRPPRQQPDPTRPVEYLVEEEFSSRGKIVPVATIFLANRECPWRCLMCDLWRKTLTVSVPPGAIPQQIAYALERMPPAQEIKLYNSGSFFDEQAIPRADYAAIAGLVENFDRTIVECHPSLIGSGCRAFRDLLSPRLEVAMGLETAHPEVLERLNKRMTLDQFARAAEFLAAHQIDLRVFILVQPPFETPESALEWAQRSLDFAFLCGATAASLIPTRLGNGAMEELAGAGYFSPPSLALLEAAHDYGIGLGLGRVFADLWDLSRAVPGCEQCYAARLTRIHSMNLDQKVLPHIECGLCGGRS